MWVEKKQPPVVILENVCGAPWEEISLAFQEKGYAAHYMRVDTKRYYIPHTRTRVYLFATRTKAPALARARRAPARRRCPRSGPQLQEDLEDDALPGQRQVRRPRS